MMHSFTKVQDLVLDLMSRYKHSCLTLNPLGLGGQEDVKANGKNLQVMTRQNATRGHDSIAPVSSSVACASKDSLVQLCAWGACTSSVSLLRPLLAVLGNFPARMLVACNAAVCPSKLTLTGCSLQSGITVSILFVPEAGLELFISV